MVFQAKQIKTSAVFAGFITMIPLIALAAPRFLAYWPGIAGLVCAALLFFTEGKKPHVPLKLIFVFIGVITLSALSSFWSINPEFALERSGKIALILLPGLLFISVIRAVEPDCLLRYLRFFAPVAALGAVLACVDLLADYPLYKVLHGVDKSADIVASNLNRSVIALCALFFTAYGFAGKNRAYKLSLFAIFAVLLALTHSQSAQLGAMLALLCFFFFPYSHSWAWKAAAVLLVAALLAAPFIAIWMFGNMAGSVNEMPFFGSGGGFGADRLEIWNAVARYALESPLYGYGIEATRFITDFDIEGLYRQSATALHPHNFALQIWIEFGAFGAVLASSVFVFLLKAFGSYNYKQARLTLPSFLIVLSAAAFGYGLWQSWFLGLMITVLGLGILSARIYDGAEDSDLEKGKYNE